MTLVPQHKINYLNANLNHLQATKRTCDEAHLTQGTKFKSLDLPQIYFSATLEAF